MHFPTTDAAQPASGPDDEYAAMEVAGRDVLHLQCRDGSDTVCLARHGARAVGLDRSPASVAAARRMAGESAVDVEYVEADVHDAVAALRGRRFDLVYTGKGALHRLPDLRRWARVVAALLRPGGALHLVEVHPVIQVATTRRPATDVLLAGDYFAERVAPFVDPIEDADAPQRWLHNLGDVVGAVLAAGLRVTDLQEHPVTPLPRPGLRVRDDGWWSWPAGSPRLPLLYSLHAVRDDPDGC